MKVQIIGLLLFCLQLAVCKQPLYILGIYPNTGSGWTEPFVVYSAELAKRHIEQNETILKNYEIVIDWHDTQCNGGVATKNFIDALAKNRNRTYLAVFGGGCAVATSEVASISYRYGLVQIAYASTAPNLGNQDLYPKFVRGVPSDINAVPARAKFIAEQNWKRVAIINEQHPIFVASSHNMEVVLDGLNIDYRVEDFAPDGLIPLEQQVRTIASNLRTYRVIIANMYEDSAIELFCLLRKQNEFRLLHPYTTWIFLGWFTDQWHNQPATLANVNCTAEEVAEISNGALGFLVAHNVTNFQGRAGDILTISGRNKSQLYEEYKNITLEGLEGDTGRFRINSDVHDAYVYDSLWTLALSLQHAEDNGTNLTVVSQKQILEDADYFGDNSPFSLQIYEGMLALEFQGWAGWVKYCGNQGHERIYDLVQILEFVNGSLEYRGEITNIPDRFVNYTDVGSMGYVLDDSVEYQFKYWDASVASDGIVKHEIPLGIIVSICVFSFLLVAYITFYVVFIIIGKIMNLESIQNSSPTLTSIIICGNYFLVLASIFFISNDRIATNQEFVSNVTGEVSTTEVCDNNTCKFLCMFPIYLVLLATSIIFGAMMSKAALIYVVVVKLNIKPNKMLNHILSVSWPFILAIIDTLFVLLWSLVGPLVMKSVVELTDLEDPPFYRVKQCTFSTQNAAATNAFIIILIVYKSCVVLLGLIMAYNLRSVQRQILRYGSTISWTMYNMTIFTLILILSFFLIQKNDVKISIVSFLILATVFLTVTIIGFPPVYYSIPFFKTKSIPISVPVKHEIVADRKMLEKSIFSLQKDNTELKARNVEMKRKMSVNGLEPSPSLEKRPLPNVDEENKS